MGKVRLLSKISFQIVIGFLLFLIALTAIVLLTGGMRFNALLYIGGYFIPILVFTLYKCLSTALYDGYKCSPLS
jgi:hypothetical protein